MDKYLYSLGRYHINLGIKGNRTSMGTVNYVGSKVCDSRHDSNIVRYMLTKIS